MSVNQVGLEYFIFDFFCLIIFLLLVDSMVHFTDDEYPRTTLNLWSVECSRSETVSLSAVTRLSSSELNAFARSPEGLPSLSTEDKVWNATQSQVVIRDAVNSSRYRNGVSQMTSARPSNLLQHYLPIYSCSTGPLEGFYASDSSYQEWQGESGEP